MPGDNQRNASTDTGPGERREATLSGGTIFGTVTDTDGTAVEGATVAALDSSTGFTVAEDTTASTGDYSISVNDGTYDVRVEKRGFDPAVETGVTISGDNEEVNFTIERRAYKVRGELDDPFGRGVVGRNTADSGTPAGVLGAVSTDRGAGVLGRNTATTGKSRGVEGVVDSYSRRAAGVLGRATEGSGFTYGVRGETNSPDGYGLYTRSDARVEGDLELRSSSALKSEFIVSPDVTVRIEVENGPDGGGIAMGHPGNLVDNTGATIGGGGSKSEVNTAAGEYATVAGGLNNAAQNQYDTVGGGYDNRADGNRSTVGGGYDNFAGGRRSTVAGGQQNEASGFRATVGGGESNEATDELATIPGGINNRATALGAWALGCRAKAASQDAFVYNDFSKYHQITSGGLQGLSSDKEVVSGTGVTGADTFSVSAQGGVRFITGSTSSPNVTYIPGDSAGWSTTSTRTAKTNVESMDPREALAGVEDLDVATWEYEGEGGEGTGVTHVGPMAEDFHAAFDVGDSETAINSIDADGVALAAIQGLCRRLDDRLERKDERIDDLRAEADELRAENERLHETVSRQADRIDDLEDRLAALEE